MKDINLLLEEDKKNRQGEASTDNPTKTAGKVILVVIAAAVAVSAIVLPILYNGALSLRLEAVNDQLKSEKYQEVVSVKSQLASAEQRLNNKKSILGHIDEQAFPVNHLLNAVKNNTPNGCTVNDIQYDTEKLRLGIRVQEISNVAEFLLNMDRLENIRIAENSNTIKINPGGDYVFNFDVGQKGR